MDFRKSKAVPLILIASVAVFFGFKTCYSHYEDDGYDRTYYADPSTRPVHRSGGGHYFWSGSRGYSGYSGGSSVHSGGTARGGFGASGHAAS